MARLQSFISRVVAQAVAVARLQLRIRDTNSFRTPRQLNVTRSASAPVRPLTPFQARWLIQAMLSTFGERAKKYVSHTCEICGGEHSGPPHTVKPRSFAPTLRATAKLMRLAFPRTAPHSGLWAHGRFSPGKPSTLVVSGSPALGSEGRNPRL